jgi:hypothetical protein
LAGAAGHDSLRSRDLRWDHERRCEGSASAGPRSRNLAEAALDHHEPAPVEACSARLDRAAGEPGCRREHHPRVSGGFRARRRGDRGEHERREQKCEQECEQTGPPGRANGDRGPLRGPLECERPPDGTSLPDGTLPSDRTSPSPLHYADSFSVPAIPARSASSPPRASGTRQRRSSGARSAGSRSPQHSLRGRFACCGTLPGSIRAGWWCRPRRGRT